MSGFWEEFVKLGQAVNDAAHQKKVSKKARKGGRRGRKKPECTPCAAQAYVDALRPSTEQ